MFRRKSDPVAEAEAELAKLKTREGDLTRRHAEAAAAFETVTTARREALVEDVDAAMSVVSDADISAAAAQLATLKDAVSEVARRRQEAECRLAAAREAVKRAKAAEVMATTHAEISRSLAAFQRSATELLAALGAVAIGGRSLASQHRPFLEGMIGEIGALLADLQRCQANVAAGNAPIPVIAPPSEPVPAPPPIERMPVFTLRQVRWVDDEEGVKTIKTTVRHAMVNLPVATAQRALARGVVLPHDDPRVHRTPDMWGVTGIRAHGPTLLPLPAHECYDLDAIEPSAATERIAEEATA